MTGWLITMGPHRFVIDAESQHDADVQLDDRLRDLALERRDPEFHELDDLGRVIV